MLFNSYTFLLFLPVAFAIYWLLSKRSLKLDNVFLVVASYLFYGWWDWRFLSLIIVSTLVDYYAAKNISKAKLWLSLVVNLGFLGFFKYYNFFADSWIEAWGGVGVEMHASSLHIILPVGISFYTFQTISYTIDVYRGKLKPADSIVDFAAFVSFFPQLVAGPIERATKLLPQIQAKREFNYDDAVSGLRLMLWGMFKKVVVADTCARYADAIFSNYAEATPMALVMGAVYFSFQIYGDFSGYSDIAIGTSRLFGIKLSTNFSFPYFSRDIAEFWRRWHISLSTWFRDYLYIPLGGSRGGKYMTFRNVVVIFLVSGFWHGANWTFVAWGAVHAALFMPLILLDRNRKHITDVVAAGKWCPSLRENLQMVTTFAMVTMAWVFFRAETISDASLYLKSIIVNTNTGSSRIVVTAMFWVAVMLIVDWFQREGTPKWWLDKRITPVRWIAYGVLVWLCLKNLHNGSSFIYFQF